MDHGLVLTIPIVRFVIWIKGFLRRTNLLGDVLEIHANARPGLKAAAHAIDENIGGLEMTRRLRMPRFPALQPLLGI